MAMHLSGRLPTGDTNGLARMAPQLHAEPEDFYGIARFHVTKLVDNLDDAADPTGVVLSIVHVEPIGEDQALAMMDLYAQRTGKIALPWDEIPTGDETQEPEP